MPSRRRALLNTASKPGASLRSVPTTEQARRFARLPEVGLGDLGVPDVEEPHPGVAAHPLAIGADGRHRRVTVLSGAEAVLAAGDDHAHRESLDVPFPWPRESLVEVVGVEDERSLRRREQAEVGQMGVAARLDHDVRAGRRGEVEGHDRRRPPVVRERPTRPSARGAAARGPAAGPSPGPRGSRSGRGRTPVRRRRESARGTRCLAAFPAAARSSGLTHGRAVHVVPCAGRPASHAASYAAAVPSPSVALRGRRVVPFVPRHRITFPFGPLSRA